MMLLEGNISSEKPTVIFNVYIFFAMREGGLPFINAVDVPLEVPYVLLLYFSQVVTVSSRKPTVFFHVCVFFNGGR